MCKMNIMDSTIYSKVKDIAIDLANTSAIGDKRSHWEHYQKLLKICQENEKGIKDHPFQWESLADFTNDPEKALEIYEKALVLAESQELLEYSASVNFAMAEKYRELGIDSKAFKKAQLANELAKDLDDFDLRKDISGFLLNEL
jgi:tetratricopeptide (TPR) repeat protein